MAKLAKFLVHFLEIVFGKSAAKLCSIADKLLDYLLAKQKDKKEDKQKQEKEKAEKRIDDICDNGSLEDLLDL